MGCAQGKQRNPNKPTEQHAKNIKSQNPQNNAEKSQLKTNNNIIQNNNQQSYKIQQEMKRNQSQNIVASQLKNNIDQTNKSDIVNKSGIKQMSDNNKSGKQQESMIKSGVKQNIAGPIDSLSIYQYKTESKPQFSTFKKDQTNQTAEDEIVHDQNNASFDLGINFNMQVEVQ